MPTKKEGRPKKKNAKAPERKTAGKSTHWRKRARLGLMGDGGKSNNSSKASFLKNLTSSRRWHRERKGGGEREAEVCKAIALSSQ